MGRYPSAIEPTVINIYGSRSSKFSSTAVHVKYCKNLTNYNHFGCKCLDPMNSLRTTKQGSFRSYNRHMLIQIYVNHKSMQKI